MIQEALIFVVILTVIIVMMATLNNKDHYQVVLAHDFSTTDESSIVTLVEQIKGETQLVISDHLSNNNISAHTHARNAAALIKILENNLTQTSPPSSGIAQIYDIGQRNSTTLALVVANIVDDILRNYGSAFAVGYDMTNMSNMLNKDMMMYMDKSPSRSAEMASSNAIGSVVFNRQLNTSKFTETSLKLVDAEDYKTGKVLSSNIKDIFRTQLLPRSLVNETANLNKLEICLENLEQAANIKALPEAMMELVHIQIHPTLQNVYDLELRRNVMTGNSD